MEYEQTKNLIRLVLKHSVESEMRKDLNLRLKSIKSNEGQFYAGIVAHGPYLKLASEDWFRLYPYPTESS